MLQQHATCLQQNLLTTNTNTTTATSTTTTNGKLLEANKKRLLSHYKHENLLLKKRCPWPQRITQNLIINSSSHTENVALHSQVWQKTNGSLFKICCKQQKQQRQQRACLVNARTTLEIRKKWALKHCCLNRAKAQTFKTGRTQSLCQQYKPGLNSLKLRQLLARPKPKLQIQAQTALKATLKSSKILVTATNITINSIMLLQQKKQQQQPECNLKNHAETLDFNSRRRRGRLRLMDNDIKRYNTENNKNSNKKNAMNNKENYVPATMFSNINAKVNDSNSNSNSNMFITTTTIIIITILINIIKRIKTFVNKPTQKTNNNKTNNNLVLSSLINKTFNQPTTRTRSTSTHSASSSSSSSSSSSLRTSSSFLLYAFLFALILLILPCHQSYYLAEAAKPKSATQQQQQLHQQQQQQQQHRQHQQDKPLIAYAAGDDNVLIDKQGTVLTPPSYQIVSSQTSNEEDVEYTIESDERTFDLENESVNEVNEDELESFEKFENGEHI